ncbi:MAG: hypothetical protein RLZZ306_3609 [Bacteroidota bacterium]|jgi:hypothetical protein
MNQFSQILLSENINQFLHKIEVKNIGFTELNELLFEISEVIDFFNDIADYEDFIKYLSNQNAEIESISRTEFGDFQTNNDLSVRVVKRIALQAQNPTILFEPTFGEGNLLLAGLQEFSSIEKIIGVEIYKPYIWKTKFIILDYYLQNPSKNKPSITLYHESIFDFDLNNLAKSTINDKILILGNPPWVTNAQLTTLESDNLPRKSNFKNNTGLDAMTGKGNFDIGEFITQNLIRNFQNHQGSMAFLVKNIVIKNITFDQKRNNFLIQNLQKYHFDAKKEFNASVEASLFFCEFNNNAEQFCREVNLDENKPFENTFGWINNKFVAIMEDYEIYANMDGVCPFEWRQGVKHDCTAVMELRKEGDSFFNAENEKIELEKDLVYPFLKSSDLKNKEVIEVRKYTIIPQKKIGQETDYIKECYPLTYQYLKANEGGFDKRKSSIYRGKPKFSIFGIGDYSFKPYKVAISGLYKTFSFTLVFPLDEKPIMLDDTCYFLGFDTAEEAIITHRLLNHGITQKFLKSIVFLEAKRAFTKDILMRIDLLTLARLVNFSDLDLDYSFQKEWDKYVQNLHNEQLTPQLSLF